MKWNLPVSTRAFLFAFVPICLTWLASYFVINHAVKDKVKEALRDSLNRAGTLLNTTGPEYNRRYGLLAAAVLDKPATLGVLRQFLRKAASYPKDQPQIHKKMAAPLYRLSKELDYDFVGIADLHGKPIGGCFKKDESDEGIVCSDSQRALASKAAYCLNCHTTPATDVMEMMEMEDTLYNIAYLPVREGDEILGSLIVGTRIGIRSLENFIHTAVLDDKNHQVLLTTFHPEQIREIDRQFQRECLSNPDGCEVKVGGRSYLALQPEGVSLPGKNILLTFQSIDAETADFMNDIARVVLPAGVGGVFLLLLFSAAGARAISKPIKKLVAHLSESKHTGRLRPDFSVNSPVKEVNQLAEAFNRAADTIQESQEHLEESTLQFVETMATALDARAPHTAGHSNRVSVNATAIAETMGLPQDQVAIIRIGARLHDIGKIGILDAVLRKPGRLTPEEYAQIRLHPQIGKRILEKVGRFQDYLPIVELHHENYDGSGYPYGLKGTDIPLGVRIVHVTDVYDALTSRRVYRDAMPEDQALIRLMEGSGTLFDPAVVEVFLKILTDRKVLESILGKSMELPVSSRK